MFLDQGDPHAAKEIVRRSTGRSKAEDGRFRTRKKHQGPSGAESHDEETSSNQALVVLDLDEDVLILYACKDFFLEG